MQGEIERGYVLSRARTLHEHRALQPFAYLAPRTPQVEVVGLHGEDATDEETKDAMLKYVIFSLLKELFTELMEGLRLD
jgi:hypothetical protein